MLTHALRPTMRDGLVRLVPDARDRRAKRAVLTAPGRTRLQQAVRLWAAANRQVEALLGADAGCCGHWRTAWPRPNFSAPSGRGRRAELRFSSREI